MKGFYGSNGAENDPCSRKISRNGLSDIEPMRNPLESLTGTVILGLLLTAVLYGIVRIAVAA